MKTVGRLAGPNIKPRREKATNMIGPKCYHNIHADGDEAPKTNT
jgi:hypothetical protein